MAARWRWLGHPAFLASVAVLALNDHVLKREVPGWWTGKLSDVAGLAVVATLAAVPIGVGGGLAAAGIGFALLKTVPGVADAAAPVLGGVTATDPSDLLALVVLVPLAVGLRRSPSSLGQAHPPARRRRERRRAARTSGGAAAVVPLLGGMAAVMTATATSCAPDPAVTQVIARAEGTYALVEGLADDTVWARSVDGGRTWWHGQAPGGPGVADPDEFEPRARGPRQSCAGDACYRVRGQRVVERRTGDGAWTVEFELTGSELGDIATGCADDPHTGVLESITAGDGDGPAVASLGAAGVLVRSDDGTWVRTRVLNVPGAEGTAADQAAHWAGVVAGPLMAIVVLLYGRRRWPSWRAALAVVGVGWWITVLFAMGASLILPGGSTSPERVSGWLMVVGSALTWLFAVAAGHRPVHRRVPPVAFPLSPSGTAPSRAPDTPPPRE